MGTTKDIREAVQDELIFDPLVDATDITVRNMNGEVGLNGTVPSYPQYLLAVVLPDEDYRDDAWLTTAANNALTLNVTVPDGVAATARDGNLTLTGLAGFGRQREAAQQAVAGLVGVRNVKDEIEITGDADPAGVTGLVQDALDRNLIVEDDSDIHVDASGNTVTLGGHVRTWAEHDAVVGATWMAPGVAQVRDYLDVTG